MFYKHMTRMDVKDTSCKPSTKLFVCYVNSLATLSALRGVIITFAVTIQHKVMLLVENYVSTLSATLFDIW